MATGGKRSHILSHLCSISVLVFWPLIWPLGFGCVQCFTCNMRPNYLPVYVNILECGRQKSVPTLASYWTVAAGEHGNYIAIFVPSLSLCFGCWFDPQNVFSCSLMSHGANLFTCLCKYFVCSREKKCCHTSQLLDNSSWPAWQLEANRVTLSHLCSISVLVFWPLIWPSAFGCVQCYTIHVHGAQLFTCLCKYIVTCETKNVLLH